jgi:hypothetical protein
VLLYGAQLYMPLSERFAVTGAANLLTPASTGTVDAYLGVTFFPGHGAFRAAGSSFAPLQPRAIAKEPGSSEDTRFGEARASYFVLCS